MLMFFALTVHASRGLASSWRRPCPVEWARSLPAFSALGTPLLFLGTFAPALVALGLTAWDEGRPGTKALVDRLFEWPAGWQWYNVRRRLHRGNQTDLRDRASPHQRRVAALRQ